MTSKKSYTRKRTPEQRARYETELHRINHFQRTYGEILDRHGCDRIRDERGRVLTVWQYLVPRIREGIESEKSYWVLRSYMDKFIKKDYHKMVIQGEQGDEQAHAES